MAGRLNARKVETLSNPGHCSDGNNLYLFISPNGGKRWTFFYRFAGGRKEMGLGGAARGQVSLAEARSKALEARRMLNAGTDPMTVMSREARGRRDRTVPTFGAFADDYLTTHRPKSRNDKHVAQWEMKGGQFALHARALPGIPYDGRTLAAVIPAMEKSIGNGITRILADAGYRGHNAPLSHSFRVFTSGQKRRMTPTIKREMRRRSAVEPVIGHIKNGHRMNSNYLAGPQGDATNAVLAAAGYNFRLILNWLRFLLYLIAGQILPRSSSPHRFQIA